MASAVAVADFELIDASRYRDCLPRSRGDLNGSGSRSDYPHGCRVTSLIDHGEGGLLTENAGFRSEEQGQKAKKRFLSCKFSFIR